MPDEISAETQYWVRTEKGRVWGPYTALALERLRGQLSDRCEVALDGKTFRPSGAFPQLKHILVPAAAVPAAPRERMPPPPPRMSAALKAALGMADGGPAAEAQKAAPAARAASVAKPPGEVLAKPAPLAGGPPLQPAAAAPPVPEAKDPTAKAAGTKASPPEAPAEVPAAGDLEQLSFVRLYAFAAQTAASGLLRIELGAGSLLIAFRRGAPEQVTSTDPDLSLPRFLQKRRLVQGPQVLAIEEQAKKSGGDVVAALFAMQIIPPSDAHRLLAEHALFLLDRALVSFRGPFTFAKDTPPPPGAFPLGQKWALLAEAMRRADPAPLRARLGKRLSAPVVRSGGLGVGRLEELSLNAQEARLYAAIDGTRTGEDLLKTAPDAGATPVRLLYLLQELGHLAFSGEPGIAAPPSSAAKAAEPAKAARPGELPRIAQRPPPADAAKPAPPRKAPPVVAPAAKAAPPAPAGISTSIPPPPAGETPDAQLLRVKALEQSIAGKSHFEALGLPRKATAVDVKRAFFVLARDLHPDTVSDPAQEELRGVKERLFARINEAARVLGDDKHRKEYERELDGAAAKVDVARIFAAEDAFRKAEILIKVRKYSEGLALLDEAIELNGNEAEFYAWRGYARFLAAKDREAAYADGVAECKRALKMVERCVPAHLFLGQMAKIVGKLKEAQAAFQSVVALEPAHIEAQRELRLLAKK